MHFPLKLYQLVQAGPPEVIAWSDNGKSFLVVDADIFCNKILPKHFRHNKLTSFQRQLNLYGFQRIAKGTEAGRYYHALFDKNRPDRLSSIKRESRTGMANGEVDEQPLPLTDDDGECSNAAEASVPVSNSSRSRTRSSRSVKEKPVVAGPEDHTAALAMINISRSLSSECLEAQDSLSSKDDSPGLTPSSIFTKLHPTDFETILKKSLERQTALEAEVVQLKSLVNTMMAKMETLSRSSAHTNSLNSGLETLSDTASSSCSVASNQSDDEEKRRYESEEEDLSQNKRLKREEPTTPTPLIQTSPESPVDSPGMSYDQ